MRYYLLKQYQNVDNPIKLPRGKEIEEIVRKPEISYWLPVDASENTMWLPLYTYPTWIIDEYMHDIIENYQVLQKFIPVALGSSCPKTYYLYKPYVCECLHEETEFWSKGGPLKRLVLDRKKIGFHKIFQIAGILENYLVADFEIVEKLLCAGVYPFEYEEVEVQGRHVKE